MGFINGAIRCWAGLMYTLRPIAYLRGKGPFVRNEVTEAWPLNNFLGKPYPHPHLPGTRYHGKLIKRLEREGTPSKVSLAIMPLDVDVDFIREDGLSGIAQFQILYHVPRENKSIEKYGRFLEADPERLREPLKSPILERMFVIKDGTDLVKIADETQDVLTFDGVVQKIARTNKRNLGIHVDGVSLESIRYDEESQKIRRKKADAVAEVEERQIMSEGLSGTLNSYFEAVRAMYSKAGLLDANPEIIWREAKRFYELDRQHSMTQNPGSTVIVGGGIHDQKIIPLRQNQPEEEDVTPDE